MGTESFGNKPAPAQPGWAPGVLAVANDTHRVYTRWVNGNEDFVYRGDVEAVNAALVRFAAVKDERKEVIVLAGPGETTSFKKKLVRYDWRMHVPSGVYLSRAMREVGTRVMPVHASLTIHVTKKLPVDKLTIPDGVKLVGAEDLIARYTAGLESKSATIRMMAVIGLAEFPYDHSTLSSMLTALDDEHASVRIVAARLLAKSFGKRAAKAIDRLEELRDDKYEKWRKEYAEIVETVRKAEAKPKSPILAGQMAWIRAFIDGVEKTRAKKASKKKARQDTAADAKADKDC